MTTDNPLAAVAAEASEEGAQEALIDMLKMSFTGMNGEYEASDFDLGDPVKFEVSGFVRRAGREWIEKDESARDFVQVKITGMRRIG